jgi:hypothetical protein
MIKLTLNNTNWTWPSEFSEISVSQLDYIANTFESDASDIEQWISIIHFLSGIPVELIEEIPFEDFQNVVNGHFQEPFPNQWFEKVTVDGVEYLADANIRFTARDISSIERAFMEGTITNRFTTVAAVIFQDSRHDKLWNRDWENVLAKAEALKDVSMEIMAPYLMKAGIGFLETFTKNEATTGA